MKNKSQKIEPKVYRVEWLHNCNWRYEENSGGRFDTLKEAKQYQAFCERECLSLVTRIVEVA